MNGVGVTPNVTAPHAPFARLQGRPLAGRLALMSEAPVVVIGPADRLAGLTERTKSDGELLTFEDGKALEALQAITIYQPALVVIERFFAASPRGAALISRIQQDPGLRHAEIRIASHNTEQERVLRPPPEIVMPSSKVNREEKSPLDYRGTRRATRFELRRGVVIKVDGDPATVLDMSRIGAQVLLAQAIRPYQRVRVSIEQETAVLRCTGGIAWVRYELPGGKRGGYYRAGIEFIDADGEAIELFCRSHADPDDVT